MSHVILFCIFGRVPGTKYSKYLVNVPETRVRNGDKLKKQAFSNCCKDMSYPCGAKNIILFPHNQMENNP